MLNNNNNNLNNNKWIQIYPPSPKDEKFYNIMLRDGNIVYNVEYWATGGGFDPLPKGSFIKGLVRYPCHDVYAYQETE